MFATLKERGYWTKADILQNVMPSNYTKSWRSAHNEVTRFEPPDKHVVRLYSTDIVTLYGIDALPDHIKRAHARLVGGAHVVVIKNGYWRTKTTREHINEALARFNITGAVTNDKRAGGMVFNAYKSWGLEVAFQEQVEIHCYLTNGEYLPVDAMSDMRTGDASRSYFL